jgi:hypothetical protein
MRVSNSDESKIGGDDVNSENLIPLSIVLEYRSTFFSKFKPSETLFDVCQKALQYSWDKKVNTHVSEWKISDRYGRELSKDSKLCDTQVSKQDTLFMSEKLGDVSDENLPVRVEDKIEQKL